MTRGPEVGYHGDGEVGGVRNNQGAIRGDASIGHDHGPEELSGEEREGQGGGIGGVHCM